MIGNASPWFHTTDVAGHAVASRPTDLVIFPYAGGSASAFRTWTRTCHPAYRAMVATLPGRGARLDEPPEEDFETLVHHLVDTLAPRLGRRFALFGHSLGAYLAFETARLLPREPVALFVSGAVDPQRRAAAPRQVAAMPDAQLVEELRRLGGTPPEVLEHEELLELLLPSIRADFALADDYRFRPEPILSCPVHVLGGDRDATAPPDALDGWLSRTRGPGQTRIFHGDHFYLHDRERELMAYVSGVLEQPPQVHDDEREGPR